MDYWNGTEVLRLARQVPISAESPQRLSSNNLDSTIIQEMFLRSIHEYLHGNASPKQILGCVMVVNWIRLGNAGQVSKDHCGASVRGMFTVRS